MKYNEIIDLGFYEDELHKVRQDNGQLYKVDGKVQYLEPVNPTDLWNQVMMIGANNDNRSVGIANNLTPDEIETILGTLDFFQEENLGAVVFDLKQARYRVFDWLAMAIQGRIENEEAVKVLVYSFLKVEGDIDRWIQDIREIDYEVDKNYSLFSQKANLGR